MIVSLIMMQNLMLHASTFRSTNQQAKSSDFRAKSNAPKTARTVQPEVENSAKKNDDPRITTEFGKDKETKMFIESVVNDPTIPSTFSDEERMELEKFIQQQVIEKGVTQEEQEAILKFVEEELSLQNLIQMYNDLKTKNALNPVEDYETEIIALSRLITEKMQAERDQKSLQQEERDTRNRIENTEAQTRELIHDPRTLATFNSRMLEDVQYEDRDKIKNEEMENRQSLYRDLFVNKPIPKLMDEKVHASQSWYERLHNYLNSFRSGPKPKSVNLENVD